MKKEVLNIVPIKMRGLLYDYKKEEYPNNDYNLCTVRHHNIQHL